MHLLITGGAGFLGSHFVRSVLRDSIDGLAGARVTVLDKLTYAGNFANLGPVAESKRLDFVPGDVADRSVIDAVVRGADAILHLAAESDDGFAVTNVMGTQVLLDAAIRHGTARFLQVSTDAVYGSIEAGAWTERSPVSPNTPYAASKAGADLLALSYHRTHGLPVVVTRSADTYGPYQHPEKLIPRFVTGLLSGRTVPLYGDGGQVRAWVHVDDHCRALARILLDGTPGEIYHVGGSQELSNRDLAGMLLRQCGAGRDRVVSDDDPRGHDQRHAVNDERIRSELGYRPRIEFADGLAATVQWYRDHAEWWRPLVADRI
jgi:dTDP-glucose 4,6-dehydratase